MAGRRKKNKGKTKPKGFIRKNDAHKLNPDKHMMGPSSKKKRPMKVANRVIVRKSEWKRSRQKDQNKASTTAPAPAQPKPEQESKVEPEPEPKTEVKNTAPTPTAPVPPPGKSVLPSFAPTEESPLDDEKKSHIAWRNNIELPKRFPNISVIVKTDNLAKHEERILDNYHAQTYTNKELIIIAPADTHKDTIERFKNMKKKDRITLIIQEEGIPDIEALNQAKGPTIAVMDGNDIYFKDYLIDLYRRMLDNADKHEIIKKYRFIYCESTNDLYETQTNATAGETSFFHKDNLTMKFENMVVSDDFNYVHTVDDPIDDPAYEKIGSNIDIVQV